MRLIDADLPMEQMEKLLDHHLMMGNFSADGAVSDCVEFLKTAPTIDAEPVVHGRWIDDDDGYHCSICGEDYCYLFFKCELYNYCPNCGAKMDEVSK
ncbi:MAG: hypothetical protein KBS74_04085 [Clostridiales bacterium]|nr:hypothetical protein [Candidatus Cacconaster stercorequi]